MTLHITVKDVETGDEERVVVADGDYLLVCAEPCHLNSTQVYKGGATHVLTVNGRIEVPAPPGRTPEGSES